MEPHQGQSQLKAPAQLRLRLDRQALVTNFRWFAARAGVPAIPAVKADGYGLGATEVTRLLRAEGAPAVAVSSWAEALALAEVLGDMPLLVLHGFTTDCAEAVRVLPQARPVLVTTSQCRQWAQSFPDRPADLMVDTGMNRLGITADELTAAASLNIDTIHSHLASADEPDSPQNARQLACFREVVMATPGQRHILANSAGICLGRAYCFDGVRPGLGLYGGRPHPEAQVSRVVTPEARIIQIRQLKAGDSVGYGATWTASRPTRIAILNIGYADGLPRLLGPSMRFMADGRPAPLVGRISMDMVAADVTGIDLAEGDWLPLDFDLPQLAGTSGVSQYELLVWMSDRYQRTWV